MSDTPSLLAALAQWLDDAEAQHEPDARLWGRVAKVDDEAGDAIAELMTTPGRTRVEHPRRTVERTRITRGIAYVRDLARI